VDTELIRKIVEHYGWLSFLKKSYYIRMKYMLPYPDEKYDSFNQYWVDHASEFPRMADVETINICDAHCLCISGDSVLLNNNKEKIPIKDLKVGDVVQSICEKTFKMELTKITETFKREYKKPLLQIQLADDKKIKVTPDHLIMTKRGWVKAEDLTYNDCVLVFP
jgi:hypothetical protein